MVVCKPEDLCGNPPRIPSTFYAHMVCIRLHHPTVYSVMPSESEFQPNLRPHRSPVVLSGKEAEFKSAFLLGLCVNSNTSIIVKRLIINIGSFSIFIL